MHLVNSLLLLCSAVALLVHGADVVAISSKAIFTGVDKTDSEATPVEIFRNPRNHASAVASILKFSADKANFKPAEDGLDLRFGSYRGFVHRASMFPAFGLYFDNTVDLFLTGDLNQFKEEIAENYDPGWGKPDVAAEAFVDQINYSVPEKKSGTWLLGLISIHRGDNDRINLGLASIEVAVSVDENGTIEIKKQRAWFRRQFFKVHSPVLVSNADTFASAFPVINIKTYEKDLTTPRPDTDNQLNSWLNGLDYTCDTESPNLKSRRQRLYPLSQLRMDY